MFTYVLIVVLSSYFGIIIFAGIEKIFREDK